VVIQIVECNQKAQSVKYAQLAYSLAELLIANYELAVVVQPQEPNV
jgi:hypothetical protein